MKLNNVWIINHKSLQNVRLALSSDSYLTMIGVNDTGKSTILDSLRLFFEDKTNLPMETGGGKMRWVSNSPLEQVGFNQLLAGLNLPLIDEYRQDSVYILIEFGIEKIFTVDEIDNLSLSEHLQWVLRDKGIGDSIYILRVVGSDDDHYLVCCRDAMDRNNNQPMQLWGLKQADIQKVQEQYGVKDSEAKNQNRVGPLKNFERMVAIYSKLELLDKWSRYSFKKDRGFFPQFKYLNWGVGVSELNDLVGTAIQSTLDQSLKNAQAALDEKREDLNEAVNKELGELYDNYSDYLPASITGLNAEIAMKLGKSTTDLFVDKETGDDRVHIEDQGDGIKRQIGLGLIRAIAEKELEGGSDETKYLWVFDEPETHLYPQAQREFAQSLKKLCESRFQVVVSTHSITFVDRTQLKDVCSASLVDGYTQLSSTNNPEDALTTLGVKNSDFLFYDKFIAVEGETEYRLLDHFHNILQGEPLTDAGIQAISLGGKPNRNHYAKILEDVMKGHRDSKGSILYILDRDTGNESAGVYLVGEVADFEDSIANEVWINLLKEECGVDISASKLDDFRGEIDVNQKDTKLHKRLSDHVASSESKTCYLSSKGEALANDLKKHISEPSQIPEVFKTIFNALGS